MEEREEQRVLEDEEEWLEEEEVWADWYLEEREEEEHKIKTGENTGGGARGPATGAGENRGEGD